MLAKVVTMLRSPEEAMRLLNNLGRRHVKYGVLEKHYDAFELALVDTLAKEFGPAFTLEIRESWIWAAKLVSTGMKGDFYK